MAEPRVNSARLPDHKGKVVRLPCKVTRFDDNAGEIIVQSSDRGEVRVKLIPGSSATAVHKTYIEIIGMVSGDDEIKAQAVVNLADDCDLELTNFVVEKWHDPRYARYFKPS